MKLHAVSIIILEAVAVDTLLDAVGVVYVVVYVARLEARKVTLTEMQLLVADV